MCGSIKIKKSEGVEGMGGSDGARAISTNLIGKSNNARVSLRCVFGCTSISHRSHFPFSAQAMVVYHFYKYKWMTREQIEIRFRQIEWEHKIRTARKRRLAYQRNRRRDLEVLVVQYLVLTRNIIVFADSDASTESERD